MPPRRRAPAKTVTETPDTPETPPSARKQVGRMTQKMLNEIESEFGFPSGQLAAAHNTVVMYNLVTGIYELANAINLDNKKAQREALADVHQAIRKYFIADAESEEEQ